LRFEIGDVDARMMRQHLRGVDPFGERAGRACP
jgi:hypothetical protein